MKYVLIISGKAKKDIRNSITYIADVLDNNQAALRLYKNIDKKFELVTEMPLINPLVREPLLADNGVRMQIIGNYKALYKVDNDAVIVLRFFNKRQDWVNLLSRDILNEDE